MASPAEQAFAAALANGTGAAAQQRPSIQISTQIHAYVRQGEQALLAANVQIYQRDGRLVRVVQTGEPPQWLDRPQGAQILTPCKAAMLRCLAGEVAIWERYDKRAKAWEAATPPRDFAETLLEQGAWPFPYLDSIVSCPTLRPDGSLLDTPGYDASTGLLYAPDPACAFPAIPPRPTRHDAGRALLAMRDMTRDFPFTAPTDQASAMAALLTLVARHAIRGNVPLFAVRSTAPATGKGLLVDALSLVGTGRLPAKWANTTDDEENRKRLLTVAASGDPVLCIDNVAEAFGSPALDVALTSGVVSDRAMKTHETLEASWRATAFVTGNNLVFKGDTARRTLLIDLDPRVEHPESRTDFTHTPLLAWVREHRGRLVMDALTLLRAYIVAGRPPQGLPVWGSFEPWSDLIRGALVWMGDVDPAGNRHTIEADNNPEHAEWVALLDAWETCFGTKPVTLRQCTLMIEQERTTVAGAPPNQWDDLNAALDAFDPRRYPGQMFDAKRVGKAMQAKLGQVRGYKRLIRNPKSSTKGAEYMIEHL